MRERTPTDRLGASIDIVRADSDTSDLALVRVTVDGETMVELPDVPLLRLADQLEAWAASVDDDAHCTSFLVRDPLLQGTFRIEPRPLGWQFTSCRERRRHTRLLTLADWRTAIAQFVRRARRPREGKHT